MFDARQYRANSRQSSVENRMLWVAASAVGVCVVAVIAAAAHVVTAPASPSSPTASRAGDAGAKGAAHYTREWFQFNRGRKDGQSAEDFVYANCMAASAYASGMRSIGADPFAGVQATLDKHAPKRRSNLSAEEGCREASRGYRWQSPR